MTYRLQRAEDYTSHFRKSIYFISLSTEKYYSSAAMVTIINYYYVIVK